MAGYTRTLYQGVNVRLLYENTTIRPRLFKLITAIATVQLGFWAYLSHFIHTKLPELDNRPPSPNTKKFDILTSPKLRAGLSIVSLGAGVVFAVSGYLYPMRAVKRMSLRQDKLLDIVTFTPLGNTRVVTASLRDASCSKTKRTSGQFGVKVKGHAGYYLMDHTILNNSPQAKLFDKLITSK